MSRTLNIFLLMIALAACTSISGCLTAGLGPQFTQPVTPGADKAVIYVYRSRLGVTATTNPGVKVNDASVVSSLYELNYFPLSVDPGSYTFTPKQFGIFKTTEATVNARAGQIYYVRLDVKVGHLMFVPVDKDEAMGYMATCYMVNPSEVTDPRVMVGKKSTVTEPSSIPPQKVLSAQQTTPTAAAQEQARLYVQASPATARIRIMNIKPRFAQGIELDAGRYHVEVSAPGYVKYLEWITLQAGVNRTLRIDLAAKKVADASESNGTLPKSISPSKQKGIASDRLRAPAGVSDEEKRYAAMFASTSAIDIRNAAKNLYYRHSDSAFLASAAEQCLLNNYNNQTADANHSDAMAWLCKALAKSGEQRFAATLKTVAKTAHNRKVRRYAEKSLNQLL